ncbi:MAG: radical SAM family heme chaperone HemW [Pseudomonadota bacterium]
MPEPSTDGGFGIYVHWPFCAAKCPYCDFNSHVSAHVDETRWREALCREVTAYAGVFRDRPVETVFFGGGTPSLMPGRTVAAVLETIAKIWGFVLEPEITLEANPTSVEAGRFRDYAAAGVNRLSLGVQALNDADLRRLGRLHSAEEARAALSVARAVFARVSFDLIYARQNQTPAQWSAELAQALELAPDHLALYQLTIEPGTAFGTLSDRGRLRGLPDDDRAAELYDQTQALCAKAGLPAYEISNHARPGSEGRHNLIYWRSGHYLGIGPGAHGRYGAGGHRVATATERDPQAYLDRVAQFGHGRVTTEAIAEEDQAEEYLMMALRLCEGADLGRFAALGGEVSRHRIAELVDDGFLSRSGTGIAATPKGRKVLNALLAALLDPRTAPAVSRTG